MLKYLKDYKKESILGPIFKLLEASFELLVPLVIAAIIDNGIYAGDRGYVVKMCILLIALASVGLASSLTAQYFAAKASVGFTSKIRHILFCHIQKLSYTELDEIGVSTLITRLTSDTNQVQTGVNLTLRLLLRSPFVVFGAMIMAMTVDIKASLVFVIVIPILFAVVFFIMLKSLPLYKKVQKYLDDVLGITRENLTGSRVIRAFCMEEGEVSAFDEKNALLTTAQNFVGRISAVMNPLTYLIINFAVIVLIYAGAIRVNNGNLTQGEVVALYNYMSQILVELIKLANLIINITKSIASGNRIQAVLEKESSLVGGDVQGVQRDSEFAVEFKNVALRYSGASQEALTDISFAAKPGEMIGIIGGTGSGKSSLVNLIPRFYEAEGEVLVDGINVKNYKIDVLRKKIGIVPQKAVLFSGSIRENLLWGNENASDDELFDALKTAQALDIVRNKENGLDEIVQQGGRNLSGGQRQRLAITRALVKKAPILIMDDSASALDFATDARLREAIGALPENPCVFVASQRAGSVMQADKILVLDDGKLCGVGTHKELLQTCEVYKEIYSSQFETEASK